MFNNTSMKFLTLLGATLLLLTALPAQAQRTGDHIVPAIETVCDGDPFNFGLCNAYCEALDCDSDTPLGTPKACANKLKNYVKHSGGALPPCEQSCPCDFDVESDFADVVQFGNEEFSDPDTGEGEIDVEGTYDEFCDAWGPNGENAFVGTAFQFDPGSSPLNDPQGVALFYWVEEAGEDTPASCNEIGGGFDGIRDIDPDFSYGPWIDRRTALSGTERIICSELLAKLCPSEQP